MAMRLLTALSLLLVCATGNASAIICPDGVTYADGTTAGCPVNSTALSISNIAQTTAEVSGTADAQAATPATGYHWTSSSQFPPGCTSLNYAYADLSSAVPSTKQAAVKARQKCMNWQTMVAGTGATSYGSATVSAAGVYTVPITGLTAATTYYVQHFVMGGAGGAGKVGVVSSQLLFTNEAGAAPGETFVADAGAAPRFIGAGGNDASDGLTHATRWLTLSKVTGALPAGTNIGLLNTSTFQYQSLDITYAGTSLDRNIIGSYKLNGSSVEIWTVDGVKGSGTTDAKAIISGHLDDTCITTYRCDYRSAALVAAGLTDFYDAYIKVAATADYTTIQNIEVSYAGALPFTADGTTGNPLTNIIIDGVDATGGMAYFAHSLSNDVRDSVLKNSYIDRHNMCPLQWRQGPTARSTIPAGTDCSNGYWSSGIALSRNGTGRNLVENNVLARGHGEGINVIQSRYHIVRNNIVSNTLSNSIYADGSAYTVIEGNIAIGGSNYAGTGDQGNNWSANMGAYKEDWQSANYSPVGIVIRNNLLVRSGRGLEIGLEAGQNTAGIHVSSYVVGNTTVHDTSVSINHQTYTNIDYAKMYDNVSWGTTATLTASGATQATVCYFPTTNGGTIAASHNHWFATQTDTDCNSSATTGTPAMSLSAIGDWADFDHDTYPTWANATPTGSGNIDQTGTARTSAILDIASYGVAWTSIAEVVAGTLTEAEWECELCVDAEGTTRGSPPSRGAIE